MIGRLGNVLYWAASAIAVLIVLGTILAVANSDNPARYFGAAMGLAAAVVVWLVGRATLYVLAGR
jgi:hypothetical protein